MHVNAIINMTTLDYPGKVASVLFTSPCNWNCPFCHNPQFIQVNNKTIPEELLFDTLNSTMDLIDGVVITGGEPTLQSDLIDFCKKLKGMGLSVKVDTNGSNPKMVRDMLESGAVDYIAMDIKSDGNKYDMACGNHLADIGVIWESAEVVTNFKNYEFRTTAVPLFIDRHSMHAICAILKDIGAKNYYIQQYHNVMINVPFFKNVNPYSRKDLEDLLDIAKAYIPNAELRG